MTAHQVKSLLHSILSERSLIDYAVKESTETVAPSELAPPLDLHSVRMTRSRMKAFDLGPNADATTHHCHPLWDYNEDTDPDYVPCEAAAHPPHSPCAEDPCARFLTPAEEETAAEGIALRTRSHLELKDVSLRELEAHLDAAGQDISGESEPGGVEPLSQDPDDLEWLAWLREYRNADAEKRPDTNNQEDGDDDFHFTYEEERNQDEDEEEYRCDKAVKITNKEIQLLLGALQEEEIDICLRKNRPSFGSRSQADHSVPLVITAADRDVIAAQLQQHVQLLTQLYLFGLFYREYIDVAATAKCLLDEIACFTPVLPGAAATTTTPGPPLGLFAKSNVLLALDVTSAWKAMMEQPSTPVLFGPSPANCMRPSKDQGIASTLDVHDWSQFTFPPLSVKMMAFMAMERFFTAYPRLLPRVGLRLSHATLARHCLSIEDCVYRSIRGEAAGASNGGGHENPKTRFTVAESQLLVLGYFQWGSDWARISENLLPTRTPTCLKCRFRNLTLNPRRMNADLRLLLSCSTLTRQCFKVSEASWTSRDLCPQPLVRLEALDSSTPSWVALLREPRWWRVALLNLDVLKSVALREQIRTSVASAAQSSGYALVPHYCLLARTAHFDPNHLFSNHYLKASDEIVNLARLPLVSTVLSDGVHAHFEGLYRMAADYRAAPVKTDSINLSTYMASFLLDLFKDEILSRQGDYQAFLRNLCEKQLFNPSEVLSELVHQSKQYPTLLRFLAYIFGVKDRHSQYRFWVEFAQTAKNLKEVEMGLHLDSVVHRKLLLFLSQLTSREVSTIEMSELIKCFPVDLKLFKQITLTHNIAVPSLLHIIQNWDDDQFSALQYEHLPLHSCSAEPPADYEELTLSSRVGLIGPKIEKGTQAGVLVVNNNSSNFEETTRNCEFGATASPDVRLPPPPPPMEESSLSLTFPHQ